MGRYYRAANDRGPDKRKADTLAGAAAGEDLVLKHLAAKRYDASVKCLTEAIRLDYDNAEQHIGRALA